MRKELLLSLMLACGAGVGVPVAANAETAPQQSQKTATIHGTVLDENGDPAIGASVTVKGQKGGAATDVDGKFAISAAPGSTLTISYVGYATQHVTARQGMTVTLKPDAENLQEVVVTALGIKKDRKSLGYALDEVNADELMKNKTANPISSLSGKVPGVNITQSSGAAGSGAQIILRGATSGSESRDNQPLFVVDGVIYDNSSSVGGNSGFDGSTNGSTTSSNRVMDINPEDIESMSVLKGPAASALYGSRAANGVIRITTKKGKAGSVEVNLSAKYITSWVTRTPKPQTTFRRGYMETIKDDAGNYVDTRYNDFTYNSWGDKFKEGDHIYADNFDNFFQNGGIWDTNLSVSAGNETGNMYLSGSFFDQDGVVPSTGYTKSTFRFNGEQKWRWFTFAANAAYSQSRTDKTLTSGGLYGSSGDGAVARVYNFGTSDDMTHYMNEDGTRYRMFGERLDPWEETDNPYWIINKNKIHDKTERFTGNFSIKADIFDWWWIMFRMGIDSYTTDYSKRLAPGGVYKVEWQDGMMSDNTSKYEYINTNLMTNFSKQFGDFGFNLLAGMTTDNTQWKSDYRMAQRFEVPGFFSYDNASSDNKKFQYRKTRKRLVGVYGEFRADWKSSVFFTFTGRNDWTSTLPLDNRSYFYPSYSGAVVVTQLLRELNVADDFGPLTFAKLRVSHAKVGKDTGAYETATALWPVGTYNGGLVGLGNEWSRGNPYLKPEMTKSTEIGLELRFFNNRLKFDYAYYTNDSYNQILSPRGPQSTGYIFCSTNSGNVLNKGMELAISGTPIQTKDWTWETSVNLAGNRGRLEGLLPGMDIMYVTDVQYGNAQAASFSGGHFMAISGKKFQYDKQGHVVLSPTNNMPLTNDGNSYEVGNREPTVSGGWNNTVMWKDWSFNMLWEFRFGGDVFNGTQYAMDQWGTSQFSADVRQKPLTVEGVYIDGYEENPKTGKEEPVYSAPVSFTYAPDQVYYTSFKKGADGQYVGEETSKMLGYNIIKNYYQNYYAFNTRNYITKVNSLRLRSISLSYSVPKSFLAKTKCIKRAMLTASATNLLLFTNYNGDPEAAASGAGVGGSSSVGFDYCTVPATASFAFGINLTF